MSETESIKMIAIGKVKPDPNQPRTDWDEHGEHVEEIVSSYSKHGIIQPLEVDEKNVIILGECRWRAAKRAGLKRVPVRKVRTPSKQDRLERQLIDDAQRKDLNDIERRWAYAAAVASINDPEKDYTIPEIKQMWKKEPKKLLLEITKRNGQGKTSGGSIFASRIGISQSMVSKVLSYFAENIPKEARKAADEGLMSSDELSRMRVIKTSKAREAMAKSIRTERKILAKKPEPKKRLSVATQDRVDAVRALERVDAPEEVIIAAAKGDQDIVESAPFIARDIQRAKVPIPEEQLAEIKERVNASDEMMQRAKADPLIQRKALFTQSWLHIQTVLDAAHSVVCPVCEKSAENNLVFKCHPDITLEKAEQMTAEERQKMDKEELG